MITQVWYRGETISYEMTYTVDGVATTLANATAIELEVKLAPGDADPALAAATLAGGAIVLRNQDSEPGIGDITLPYDFLTQTSGAPAVAVTPAGTYYFDIVVIFPGPVRRYVVKPTKVIVRDVVNQP